MNRREHEIIAHHTSLRRLARGLARTSAPADDLLQDTYITALRKAPPEAQLKPWLKAVMRKLAWGRRRSDQRRAVREDGFALTMPMATVPDALHDYHFDRERLAAALAHLPEPYHSTVVQRFFQGRSCADIARSENIPAGTVRWRQARGLELLRDALEPPRRQRARWALPVLGAGHQLVMRISQILVARASSGKALWLWLALGAMIYAISGSPEPARERPADHRVVRPLDREAKVVVHAQLAAGTIVGHAGTTGSGTTSTPSPTTGVPTAMAPGEVARARPESPATRVDDSPGVPAGDCRWTPETGWRCPVESASAAPSADPLCALLYPRNLASAALGSLASRRFPIEATLANRELARRLGCPVSQTDALDNPRGSGRTPERNKPDGDKPGGGQPACVTETGSDGTVCTTCPGEPPVCAPAPCETRVRADGMSCTVCVDALGTKQSDCPPVAAGLPSRCFSRSQLSRDVIVLDLATETIAPTSYALPGAFPDSLGLTQNHLVSCDTDNSPETTVNAVDLATGVRTSIDLPCTSVTALGDKIYVQSLSSNLLTEYASLGELMAKQPTRDLPSPYASRLGAGNSRLLAAWHAADEVLAVTLDTGAVEPIPLHNYDGWIFGLFENAQVRLVAGGWVETGINVYDTVSGQPIGRMFDGVWLQGLACSADQIASDSVSARSD